MSDLVPENALGVLSERLRAEDSVLSPHVRDSDAVPALGLLVATGPRAVAAPGEYALVVESIREGYLLHYADPRVVVGADRDLALLGGDYLYARGLERLAALEDLEAVRELSDLISLSAQIHAENGLGPDAGATRALWLAASVAVACGATPNHERAKEALRRGDPDSARLLVEGAADAAGQAGIGHALERAAESLGFDREDLPNRG